MTPTPHRRRFSRASAALDWRIFRNRNRGACYPDPHPEALHGHHSRFTHARKKREGHPFLTLDATASTARRHSPLRGGLCGWHDVPAGKLTQGVPRHRGTGQLPSATRTRSGPQATSHAPPHLPRVSRHKGNGEGTTDYTRGDSENRKGHGRGYTLPTMQAGACGQTAAHHAPKSALVFRPRLARSRRSRPTAVITSDNTGIGFVIKSDNKAATCNHI